LEKPDIIVVWEKKMSKKTIEENLAYLKTCETGYITDALNLLGIKNCWIKGVLPMNPLQGTMVGEAFPSRVTFHRKVEAPKTFYHVVSECPARCVLLLADVRDVYLIGGNMATRACNKGLSGVVVEAKNRDISDIRKLPMPVFSQGVGIEMTPPPLPPSIEINIPVDIGGAKVNPGDIVVGDEDGVLVIPRERLDDVIYQVEMVAAVEKELSDSHKNQPVLPVDDFLKIMAKKKKPRE